MLAVWPAAACHSSSDYEAKGLRTSVATTSATGLARGITDENSEAGGFLATTNDLIARERAITFNTGDNDESNPVID
jgi:hypothetical protein